MKMKDYRLVVLGSGGVGKTCLVHRFVGGNFPVIYEPTVEDIHRPIISVPGGETHGIEILDTAGQHSFPAMRLLSIQSGSAFVVVYSITDAETFKNAIEIAASVRKIRGEMAQIVLVGNKSDLTEEREVQAIEAHNLANEKNYTFTETSAKYESNIHRLFLDVICEVFTRANSFSSNKKSFAHQGKFWKRINFSSHWKKRS